MNVPVKPLIACFVSFMLLSLPAVAHQMSETSHAHHAAPAVAPCSGPLIDCAKTVGVAADRNGKIWRIFASDQALYVQPRKADGSFGERLQVNSKAVTILNGGEQRPQLAFGANNEMLVVWSEPMGGKWTCKTQFARSLDDGKHFSDATTMNTDQQPMTHCFPVMKTNNKGAVYVAWLDRREHAAAKKLGKPYHGMALYYRYSTDNGKTFAATDRLLSEETCECCRIAMTLDANGLPIVVFRKIYPNMIRDHALVSFNTFDQSNPPLRISEDHWQLNGCPEQGPAALFVDGRTHLIWYDKGQLRYRQWQGGKLGPVSLVGNKGAEHPQLATVGATLWRAWQAYGDGAMDVWVQRSDDNGSSWTAASVAASTKAASDTPELVSDGKQMWLSWKTDDEGHRLVLLSTAKQS